MWAPHSAPGMATLTGQPLMQQGDASLTDRCVHTTRRPAWLALRPDTDVVPSGTLPDALPGDGCVFAGTCQVLCGRAPCMS